MSVKKTDLIFIFNWVLCLLLQPLEGFVFFLVCDPPPPHFTEYSLVTVIFLYMKLCIKNKNRNKKPNYCSFIIILHYWLVRKCVTSFIAENISLLVILKEIPKLVLKEASALCRNYYLPPPFFASLLLIRVAIKRDSVVCFCLPLGQTDPGKAHGLRSILSWCSRDSLDLWMHYIELHST